MSPIEKPSAPNLRATDAACSTGLALWSIRHTLRKGTAMPTIAIIGAGPGLGAAVARRFGAEGFSIGLISRDQAKLDELAAQLQDLSLIHISEPTRLGMI